MFATSLALSAALAAPAFPAPKPTPDEGSGPGYLGVTYTRPAADGSGPSEMIVTDVRDGSPAQKAGLQAGDVIQKIDGVVIDRSKLETVSAMVSAIKPGTRVRVQIQRNGQVSTVMVVIKPRPTDFYPTPPPVPTPYPRGG